MRTLGHATEAHQGAVNQRQSCKTQCRTPVSLPKINTGRKPKEARGSMTRRKRFAVLIRRWFAQRPEGQASSEFQNVLRTRPSEMLLERAIDEKSGTENYGQRKKPTEPAHRSQTKHEEGSEPNDQSASRHDQRRPGAVAIK